MSEQEEPQDAAPPSVLEQINAVVDQVKEKLFSQPVLESIEQHTGFPASAYKLTNREVIVNEGKCGAGHQHRDITLVETFNTEAAEGQEPSLSLDAAIAKFKEEVSVEPEGSLGFADETGFSPPGYGPGDSDGELKRFLTLHAAFETVDSINRPKIDPMQAFIAALMGGQLGGPDDDEEDLGADNGGPKGPASGPA
jgi:hypothetical protein